jgi:hypothetical protein
VALRNYTHFIVGEAGVAAPLADPYGSRMNLAIARRARKLMTERSLSTHPLMERVRSIIH